MCINVIFIRWMMHNLQQRQMMLPDIGMRINTGPEDFIEVDLEAGLKSLTFLWTKILKVPVTAYRVVMVKS